MKKDKEIKKEDSIEFTLEERKNMIQDQLKQALLDKERLIVLIHKCHGALELIDSMEEKKEDND